MPLATAAQPEVWKDDLGVVIVYEMVRRFEKLLYDTSRQTVVIDYCIISVFNAHHDERLCFVLLEFGT